MGLEHAVRTRLVATKQEGHCAQINKSMLGIPMDGGYFMAAPPR
eukprot:COSAG02_NODE_43107_length_378_cov_0.637993_2_plen_43_part_01